MEDEPNSGYDNDDTNSQHGNSDNKVNNIESTMTTIEMMKCSICKNYVPRFDIRLINVYIFSFSLIITFLFQDSHGGPF